MRVHAVGPRPGTRLVACAIAATLLAGLLSGAVTWCWTEAACVASLHPPMRLPAADTAHALWKLITHGGWSTPSRAFPTPAERAGAPGAWAYATVAFVLAAVLL